MDFANRATQLIITALSVTLSLSVIKSKPAQATLIGDTVDCSITPNSIWSCDPTSAKIVDPGNEFALKLLVGIKTDFFSVDIGASSVLLKYVNEGSLSAGAGELLTLSDLDWLNSLDKIAGFSLEVFGAEGLTASDITFNDHSVSVNLNETSWKPGDFAAISLETDRTAVPEPSSTLGLLIVGGIGVGSMALKRKGKSDRSATNRTSVNSR